MAFDPSLDVTVWQSAESPEGLRLAVKQYNNGVSKLDLSRRTSYKGEEQVKYAGRLTRKDLEFLYTHLKEIGQYM